MLFIDNIDIENFFTQFTFLFNEKIRKKVLLEVYLGQNQITSLPKILFLTYLYKKNEFENYQL